MADFPPCCTGCFSQHCSCLSLWECPLVIACRWPTLPITLIIISQSFFYSVMSRSMEQWTQLARQKHRYFYFYEQKVLDLTDFIQLHPGGKKALINYTNKDITDILFKVYPHKKENTLNLLNKYKIGTLSDRPKKCVESKGSESQIPKEKKKVCFQKKFICDEENEGQTDDSEITFCKKRANSKKKSGNSSGSSRIGTARESPMKASKGSNKSHSPSLKSLNSSKQKMFQQDLNYESPAKKEKEKYNQASSLVLQEEFDEEKPVFLVPVLHIKHMNQL